MSRPTGRPAARRAPGEGSIFWNGQRQVFMGQVSIGGRDGRVRRTVTGATRTEVARKLRELADQARDADLSGGSVTVAQLAEKWWANIHDDMDGSTQSTQWDRVRVHIIGDRFGKKKVGELRTEDVERWLEAKMKTGYQRGGAHHPYSRRYLEMMRGDVNAMVRWAIRRHWLRWNPVTEARVPGKAPRSESKRTLTRQQALDLIEACQLSPRTCANLVLVAVITGARPSEVAALRFDDVDHEAGTIRIHQAIKRATGGKPIGVGPTKTENTRTIEVSQTVLDAIRRERVQQATKRLAAGPMWSGQWDGFIFLGATGTPQWSSNLRKALRAIAFEAGIDIALDLDPYELRHSCASLLYEAGVAVGDIVDQLGHKDDRMFWKHYRHRPDPIVRNAGIIEAIPDA